MTARANGIRLLMIAVLIVLVSTLATHSALAQTAAEMAAMPDSKQRAIIDSLVAGSITNLTSTTDQSGNAKSDQAYQDSRAMANLIRAWFVQDPDHPSDVPPGPKAILYGVKKTAASEPSKTIVDIISEFVDGYYAKFYTNFYKPENMATFQHKNDHDQAALFRVHIELEEERHQNDRIIKKFDEADAKLKQQMSDDYDNAQILTDGRHVLRDNNGDFHVIQRNPDDGADYKLDFPYTIEAASLYECMHTRGIANGMQGRAACGSGPIRPTAPPLQPSPPPQQQAVAPPQPAAPPPAFQDDPIGEGGFITPPSGPAPQAARQPATAPPRARRSAQPAQTAPAVTFKVLMCVQRDLVDQHAWEHPAFGSKTAAFRRMAIPYIQSVGQQGWEYLILDVHYNRFDPSRPDAPESMVVPLAPTSGRFDSANPTCSAKFAGYWVNVTR